jgi:hypothetical protein
MNVAFPAEHLQIDLVFFVEKMKGILFRKIKKYLTFTKPLQTI